MKLKKFTRKLPPNGGQKSEVSSQKSDVKEQWTEITGQKAKRQWFLGQPDGDFEI